MSREIDELLETMRTAVEVLREKYPALNQIDAVAGAPKHFQWKSAEIDSLRLDEYLNTAEGRGWEIFSVAPVRTNDDAVLKYAIVARRPKGDPHVE